MKKILSLILSFALLASMAAILTISTSAETSELLTSPGFEDDDSMDYWVTYGTACDLELEENAKIAHTGSNCLSLSERTDQYATCMQNVKDILVENGPGTYRMSVAVKLADAKDTASGQLVLNYKQVGAASNTYVTTPKVTLTDKWQVVTITESSKLNFDKDTDFEFAGLYFQTMDKDHTGTNYVSYYLDDFSLVKTTAVNGRKVEKLPDVEMTHLKVGDAAVQKKTSSLKTGTVGAIRWDAWYEDDGDATSVISQVEKSLGPAKYHFRAPFFADVTVAGGITIKKYDQSIFDQEMLYAKDAGIDYFAYVFYTTPMRIARDLHTTSKYRKDVKMCSIFDGNAIGNEGVRKEMATLLKQDYWMTVLDGRPLMYYFMSDNYKAVGDDIKYYRQLCKQLELPDPYVVIMNVGSASGVTKAYNIYGDAVSQYGYGGNSQMTFRQLMEKQEATWEDWAKWTAVWDMGVVPSATMGWHNGTRYENPVSWIKNMSADSWVPYATKEELQEHVEDMLQYLDRQGNEASCVANTSIIYAWNEHDEGGWVCPTIAVDENGKQLLNADGSKKINTDHLDAVKAAIANYRSGTLVQQTAFPSATAEASSGASSTDKATNAPAKTKSDTPSWLYAVIGGGVLLIVGGAVTVVFVLKKRNAAANPETDDTDNKEE